MDIKTYSLGQLQANCYLLTQDKKCIIIDPADEAHFLLELMQRERLELMALVATHGHFDHIMAAGEIQASLDVPFYIHEKDIFLVKRLNQTAKYFLGHDPGVFAPRNVKHFDLGDSGVSSFPRMTIPPFSFQVIYTPGHTPGSVCLLFEKQSVSDGRTPGVTGTGSPGVKEDRPNGILFSGDTLFKNGIGRYDFSYSSYDDLQESLKRLSKLPSNTRVLSGHGDETTIGDEL